MEVLRIRIPNVQYCGMVDCCQLVPPHRYYCTDCLDTGVSEEVTPTTLPDKTEVVHRPSLSSYLRCRR